MDKYGSFSTSVILTPILANANPIINSNQTPMLKLMSTLTHTIVLSVQSNALFCKDVPIFRLVWFLISLVKLHYSFWIVQHKQI